MTKNLEGKTVVIVGASGDIASNMALKFAEANANIVLASRKLETLLPVFDSIDKVGSGKKSTIVTDASKLPSVENLLARSVEIFGGVDVLVTSVGSWKIIEVDSPNDNFANQLDIDTESFLKAVLLPVFVFNKYFREKKEGLIVDISSHAAEGFLPGNLTYAPVKTAVKIFLDNLRKENANAGPRITRIIAQLVDTPKNRLARPKITEEQWLKTVQINDMVGWIIKNFNNHSIPTEEFFKSGIVI